MQMTREQLAEAYRYMHTIRVFETRVHAEAQAGRVPGSTSIALVQGRWDGQASPISSSHPLRIVNFKTDVVGSAMEVEIPTDWTGLLYVLDGAILVDGQRAEGRHMATIMPGEATHIRIESLDACRVLMLTGAPFNETVISHGPFVMSSYEEIQQAIMDYHDGKMGMLTEP